MIVVMLGFGMIIPIMPFYVKSFGASGSALGALMATYGLLQFLTAPFWGGLSDYYGRKPVLVIGVLGNAIAQVLFGLSTELWMLFAARALAGLLSSATLPTTMAYIGDSTSRENRGGGMGMIGATMGVGMVLGPGLGGTLASSSLALPFFLASALSLLALALILIFLPKSKPREATFQEARRRCRGPEIGAMFEALSGPVGVLLALALLLSFGLTNFESIFGLYAAQQYAYDPRQVGLVLTVIGLDLRHHAGRRDRTGDPPLRRSARYPGHPDRHFAGLRVADPAADLPPGAAGLLLPGLQQLDDQPGGQRPDLQAHRPTAGRDDGCDQLLHEPGAHHRPAVGRLHLRPWPQPTLPDRRSDHVCRIRDQYNAASQPGG